MDFKGLSKNMTEINIDIASIKSMVTHFIWNKIFDIWAQRYNILPLCYISKNISFWYFLSLGCMDQKKSVQQLGLYVWLYWWWHMRIFLGKDFKNSVRVSQECLAHKRQCPTHLHIPFCHLFSCFLGKFFLKEKNQKITIPKIYT